jgi:hypothetical protein
MRKLNLFLLILFALDLQAQDTTYLARHYDKTSIYKVSRKTDTLLIHQSTEGKVTGKCKLKNGLCHGTYTRFYPSGRKMWERQMVKGIYEGKSVFYNENSKRVAEFNFRNDTLVDTLFWAPKSYFIFVKMTYRSVVHGGVERADGGSNISEGTGNLVNARWYVAEVDSSKFPIAIGAFTTDFRGEAWVLLKAGQFNFFPIDQKVSELSFGQTTFSKPIRKNGSLGWNCKEPFVLNKLFPFLHLTIQQYSVGYAP